MGTVPPWWTEMTQDERARYEFWCFVRLQRWLASKGLTLKEQQ